MNNMILCKNIEIVNIAEYMREKYQYKNYIRQVKWHIQISHEFNVIRACID